MLAIQLIISSSRLLRVGPTMFYILFSLHMWKHFTHSKGENNAIVTWEDFVAFSKPTLYLSTTNHSVTTVGH